LLLTVSRGQVEILRIPVSHTYATESCGAFSDSSRIPREVREGDGVGVADAHAAILIQNTF
jgi:hypothetical protein